MKEKPSNSRLSKKILKIFTKEGVAQEDVFRPESISEKMGFDTQFPIEKIVLLERVVTISTLIALRSEYYRYPFLFSLTGELLVFAQSDLMFSEVPHYLAAGHMTVTKINNKKVLEITLSNKSELTKKERAARMPTKKRVAAAFVEQIKEAAKNKLDSARLREIEEIHLLEAMPGTIRDHTVFKLKNIIP